jgi:methylthioribose-1-phosphate isomerase
VDPFRFEGDRIFLLDQTLLPARESWIEIEDAPSMVEAIRSLRVRGAPAIGIAAALALAIEAARAAGRVDGAESGGGLRRFEDAARALREARPTAVNLGAAVDRMARVARETAGRTPDPAAWAARLRAEAVAIWDEDRAASRAMAEHGAALFQRERVFLTHCHTGGLATGGGGTALGVLLDLHRRREGGIQVWATETRPLLQGARITAWELTRAGVPMRLIVDGAAAHAIASEPIEAVVVGADRIARNGDVANKIGTRGIALAARDQGVPFVVVAPTSTLDLGAADGSAFVIEERDRAEVERFQGVSAAAPGALVRNPAFDVTPARLVHAIVTERGVHRGPAFSGLVESAAAKVS